eukprot:COSAG06_NODE_13689_length_1231_cov_1.530919_2_plen_52_part_01
MTGATWLKIFIQCRNNVAELGSTLGSLMFIGFSVTFWQGVLVYLYWPVQISS